MEDLAAGPHGDRVGDVLLIARNGTEKDEQNRYYFSSLYRSWHGSPSKLDSQVPLVVAHPGKSRAELKSVVQRELKPHSDQQSFTPLVMALRFGEE
jgi:hypothetical protein